MFNIDPKKMQQMMKQLGMKQENISAERVVIEKSDGKKVVIENPSVVKINMQGNESFQITGEAKEEIFSKEDVKTVMEKTNCTAEEAKAALEKSNGDLADAIMDLGK